MSEKDKNPYLAFIDDGDKEVKPTPPSPNIQIKTDEPLPSPDVQSGGDNPYLAFVEKEEEKKPLLEQQKVQEALYGAGAGALYKAHQIRQDIRGGAKTFVDPNMPMSAKGLQSYLNSQISPKFNLPLKGLETLVGKEIRTMSDVQEALKFIQGQEAQRVAKSITDRAGTTRNIYTTIPGREPVDLSEFEKTLLNRATTTAKAASPMAGSLMRGAVAGAAAAPMAIQMYRQQEPTDWTQWSSLLGSGLGLTRSGPLGLVGAAMQAPYIVKHAPEISAGLGLGEINPTMFGGSSEALTTQEDMLPEHPSVKKMKEESKAGAGRGFVNPPFALP